jgi:sugar phosphate isomerase/epimerase
MDLTRRNVLLAGAGAVAALATGGRLFAAERRPLAALQLYSLRQDMPKDVPGHLAQIAQMGYKGVEFAGYYGRSAQDLRKLLDDNGLKCCGTHTGFGTIQGDQLSRTAEFNAILGNPFLIVPGLPREATADKDAVLRTVEIFNRAAQAARAHNAVVGYHAHGGDFRKIDGTSIWEMIFDGTPREFVHQIDTGNAIGGGGDPVAMIRKYPGRSRTVHLKEHGGPRGAVIGEGTTAWKDVFSACEQVGGTEWYIVEQESYAGAPIDSVRGCAEGLKKMGRM